MKLITFTALAMSGLILLSAGCGPETSQRRLRKPMRPGAAKLAISPNQGEVPAANPQGVAPNNANISGQPNPMMNNGQFGPNQNPFGANGPQNPGMIAPGIQPGAVNPALGMTTPPVPFNPPAYYCTGEYAGVAPFINGCSPDALGIDIRPPIVADPIFWDHRGRHHRRDHGHRHNRDEDRRNDDDNDHKKGHDHDNDDDSKDDSHGHGKKRKHGHTGGDLFRRAPKHDSSL
jgi:hypothetical protein